MTKKQNFYPSLLISMGALAMGYKRLRSKNFKLKETSSMEKLNPPNQDLACNSIELQASFFGGCG
jgi:hypothetical protein